MARPKSNEEKTETDDNSQFKVVSHPKKYSIDKLCTKIKHDDLKDLNILDFNKLTKEDQNKLEEYVYAMMAEYKHTPLELDGSMPKELYKIVEDKWYFSL